MASTVVALRVGLDPYVVHCRMIQGAVREIRKDNWFLAKERLKETMDRLVQGYHSSVNEHTKFAYKYCDCMYRAACCVCTCLFSSLPIDCNSTGPLTLTLYTL